jgi:hypothetical protein
MYNKYRMLKISWAGSIIYLQEEETNMCTLFTRSLESYKMPHIRRCSLHRLHISEWILFKGEVADDNLLWSRCKMNGVYLGTEYIYRCCQECRSCTSDKCVNHSHIQIGIHLIFTFISSLRWHMLCQQNNTFCTNIPILAGNQT